MIWLKSLFETITAIMSFATKVVPSDKIREANQERVKIRREQAEIIKIYDKQFRRLKDHPEIDITTDVRLVCDNLPEDQEKALIELLTARITAYRKRHRVIFRKWLKENNL